MCTVLLFACRYFLIGSLYLLDRQLNWYFAPCSPDDVLLQHNND